MGGLRFNIRTALLALVMAAILPALIAIFWDGHKQGRYILSVAQQEQLRLTQAIAFQHEAQIQGLRQLLTAFTHTPSVQQFDIPTCNRMLYESLKKNPTILNLALTDKDGVIRASGLPMPVRPASIAGSKVFTEAVRSAEFSAGEYLLDPISNKPTLHFALPFYAADSGALRGVLLAALDLTIFNQFCLNLKLGEGQTFNLSDHRGILLQRFPKHATVVPGTADRPHLRAQVTGPNEEGTFFAAGRDNVRRLLGFKRMRLTPDQPPYLYLRLTVPEDVLMESINQARLRNLALLGGASTLALLLAWTVGYRFIASPIIALAAFARNLPLRRGATIELTQPPQEIELLNNALNYASTELKRMEDILLEERNQLNKALSEKMHAESALQSLNLELEERVAKEVENSREKDVLLLQQARFAMLGEILMNISHHWRQPLNVIGLQVQEMAYLVKDGSLTSDQAQQMSTTIMEQLIELSQTIDRFRQLHSTGQLSGAKLLPIKATSDTVGLIRSALEEQGIRITVTGRSEVPIQCPLAEFSNCIINIINNARDAIIAGKGADGRIEITIELNEVGKNRITVFNNGIPIPDDLLERIFDPYTTSKFQAQGVGLGLYIVRQTVEKVMLGTVTARNRPDGVEFVLEV